MSDTFVGIRPIDAPGFILAQLAGATAATLLFRWFAPPLPRGKAMKQRVLILCTGNSARSQMAEGLLRKMADARSGK